MRQLLMVCALATLMAALMALMAAPAMANHNDFFGFGDDDNCDFNNLFGFFGNDEDCDFNDGVIFFGNDINDDFFGNGVEQEPESGDVRINFDVSNSGDYASQCTPAIQEGNTGNFQNGSSFVQFGSGTNDGFRNRGFFFGNDGFFNRGGIDDFEPGGIDVSFGGSQDVSCPSTIEQSSAASS